MHLTFESKCTQDGYVVVSLTTRSGDRVVCTDTVLAQCSTTGDVPIPSDRLRDVALHPNPAGDRTSLSFLLASPSQVTVVLRDVAGHDLLVVDSDVMDAGDHDVPIDVARIPSGNYFVVVSAGRESTMCQLTIVR